MGSVAGRLDVVVVANTFLVGVEWLHLEQALSRSHLDVLGSVKHEDAREFPYVDNCLGGLHHL